MSNSNFYRLLADEIKEIDSNKTSKRKEKVIEGFTREKPPRAIIEGKKYYIFNSNDYLSLRFHPQLKKAEEKGTRMYGTGPGAVRFISGTLKVHIELENVLAKFHQKESAIIFSSAFAANQGVIFPLIVGQRKNTKINDRVLVISDELNHRSIIDAIRLAKLPPDQKAIFPHRDINGLEKIIQEGVNRFDRVIIVTDGVFSMLGSVQKLKAITELKKKYEDQYKNGVLIIVDDAHGVGVLGKNGRGSEELEKTKVDLIIGTFGKALGTDGGYAVGPKIIIDYLKESAATYIYSNNLTPGTANASLQALKIMLSKKGEIIRKKLYENIEFFKKIARQHQLPMAADSIHPIQPVLIGNPVKAKKISQQLFEEGFLVTPISYPVVPQGKDEIRVQINANHTLTVIKELIFAFKKYL